MRTSNPALNEETYNGLEWSSGERTMTVSGAIHRIGALLVLALVSAGYTWSHVMNGKPEDAVPWMLGGMIGGLVVAIVTCASPRVSPFTAPIYALLEGLLLGGVSAFAERYRPGIALQAVGLTFGVLMTMLFLYRTGIIQVTEKLRAGIVAATGAVFLLYLSTWILAFFGVSIPFIHSGGVVGIAFSVFVVGLAAFNLVLDFDFIEKGEDVGAPKYMEWYGAFGLMVTLVWLYIEILRLLMKLQSRD